MTDVGVLGIGAYAPGGRIAAEEFEAARDSFQGSGIQEKAVPAPDEDVVTMAYEAGMRALDAAGVAAGDVGSLSLATTNSPVDEEDELAHLGAMFGVDEGAARELHGGSTVAGLRALRSAVQTSRHAGPALVVASDAPQGEPNSKIEHAAGAGAAAFVVGQGGRVDVADMAASAEPASGVRFRRRGKEATESLGITAFDRKVFRETIANAVDSLTVKADDVDAASIQAPDGAAPYRVASAAGVDRSRVKQGVTVHELGDTGAASVPLGVAGALEDGAERILAVGYGSGSSAIAALLEVTGDVPVVSDTDGSATLSHTEYVRRRGFLASGPPEGGGGYVSLPTLHRSLPQRYRLEAGRCPECDHLNFPPSGACSHCHELVSYEPVTLSKEGELEALSVISTGGAPPEFAELQDRSGPYATGIVAFDGPDGGSASVPSFVINPEKRSVEVGTRVEMTIRRLYTQEGVPRYGFKVKPTA